MGPGGRSAASAPGLGRREIVDLLEWFDRNRRALPWRRDRDPYHRWVAEVMLQQTRVEQAVPLYERFLLRFPNVRSLSEASEGEVLKVWEGAGYYARARNLRAAAIRIASSRPLQWPGSSEAWGQLPGVGPYIARAIASQVLGEPVDCPGLERPAGRRTVDPRSRPSGVEGHRAPPGSLPVEEAPGRSRRGLQ